MQTPHNTDLSGEQTIVEGLIELAMPTYGMRATRELQVRKFRSCLFLEGRPPTLAWFLYRKTGYSQQFFKARELFH